MKSLRSLIALVLTSCVSLVAGAAPASIVLAVEGSADQLISLEKQKVDYLFGSPEQKQAALFLYATDFTEIHLGPTGVEWSTYAAVEKYMKLFPNLPPGTFTLSDFHVSKLAPGCAIVSYKIKGPGPDGAPWMALNSSTWMKRGGEWKTVFYQTTPISGS